MSDWETLKPADDGWETLDKTKVSRKTSLAEDFKIGFAGVGNTADTIGSLALSHFFRGKEKDEWFDAMNKRARSRMEWANPDRADQSVGGQVVSGLSSLPLALPLMLGAPVETSKNFLDKGEPLGRALGAGAVDLAGNAVGVFTPIPGGTTAIRRGLGNAAINVGQDFATRKILESMTDNPELQEMYGPSIAASIIAAGTGGVIGALKKSDTRAADQNKILEDIRKANKEQAPKAPESQTKLQDEVLKRMELEAIDRYNNDRTVERLERALAQKNEPLPPISVDAQGRAWTGDEVNVKNYFDADQTILDRQRDLEQEVARQTRLDMEAAARQRMENAPTGYADWEMQRRLQEIDARNQFFEQARQDSIVEDFGNNDPMARMPEMRVDENGIPIRADLSMEAQNLQNPLQRNLWGDELPVRTGDDGIPLTQALDTMEPGPIRAEAASQLSGVPAKKSSVRRRGGRQSGAIDPDLLTLGLTKLFHGGKKFSKWNPEKIGTGEGMGALGPGLYAGDKIELAKIYQKYGNSIEIDPETFDFVTTKGVVSEMAVDPTNIFDYRKPTTPEMTKKIEQAQKNLDSIGAKGTERGLLFALQNAWDKQAARQAVVDAGIDGFYVNLGDELGKEYVIFNPEAIKQISEAATPVEKSPLTSMRKSQGGYVDIGGLLSEFGKRRDKVANMLKGLGNYIPSDPDMELVRQAALQEPDGKGLTNLLESGATSAAANKRSSLILGTSRVVQNASKRAELAVRQFVFPVEDAARKLSRAELRTVSELMMDEMKSGQLYDRELLQSKLSDKQLKTYIAAREMFEQTYLMQNEARLAKGLPAFSKMEAYAASRWEGDFRMPVRNAEGKLVWYLAGDSVRSVKKQLAELQKIEPGLVPGELRRINTRNAKGIASVYHTMLDMLDQNDPVVEKIRTLFEAEKSLEAMDMLNQTKHHERKSGVRGFVGDRPWMNPEKEATAFMQQQIQYAKNAFEWSEMQGAAEKLKPLLSDPELQKVQPNNLQYVKDYLETNLGFGETKLVKEIDNTIRKAGVSPKYIAEAIGSTKLLFTLQKMALSTGYIASNILQTTWMLPHLMDLRNKGFKGNPIGSLAVGYSVGAWLALNHWSKRGVGIDSTPDFGSMVPGALGEFYAKAMKYAEDNGVTSRSIYDESQIETSMSPVKRAVDMTAKATMAFPETIVRASSFMAYVEMLRQSGQFKDNDAALFQKAEEMVNFSMVDYRYGERPMVFSKMGWAGNAANTLQTYPISFYNQWRYFTKEATRGNVMPFMTAFALQMTLAGAMGIPGVSDLDKLWDLAKKMLPASMWANIPEDSFLADPKLWALDNIGEKAVYGLLSDQTDISFTSRVAAPGLADMAAAPFGPAGDLLKQATNWASATKGDPADIAQAALSSAPIGPVQGLLENTVFRDETGVDLPGGTRGVFKSTDLAGRDQIYERDDWDTLVRNMGMRSQREAVTKEVQYRLDNLNSIKNEKGASLAESWYNNVRRGNLEKAKERAELYFKLTGKPITSTQFANQAKQEFLSTQKRMAIGADTVNEVKRYKYLKQLLEGVE